MKKSMFIPFAFLGIILASCNSKTTTKLDDKNYDLSTPKCVLEDIKSNLKNDKTIYPKYTYTNTNLYADMVSPSYNKGFVKYSKDDKYYVASFFKNDSIFESVEDINVINEESEYINKYGLSIIAFSTIIDGNPKYYIYDSYGNKILESDDNIYINNLTYINSDENIMEYQLDYLIDYSEYKTTYLRYTYNNNQIQLKQEKERMVVNDDVKYNQETTKGEISRYGYYSLKDYGEDGYYVVNDGYFAYYDENYKYKLNFKTVFNDYLIIGKYVVSYDEEEVDYQRDDYDYLDTQNIKKYNQNYIVYDITTGKSINNKLDNIVIDSIDEDTIGYVKEEDLYYFNGNIIDNGVPSTNALITIDDNFEIQSVELMTNKIDEFKLNSSGIIYTDSNKVILFDDNLTIITTFSKQDKVDSYYKVYYNGKYGIVDEKGTIIVPFEYTNIYIKNDNYNIYYKDRVLGYKNNKYYSINLATKQSTLLENCHRDNYGIDYINDENNKLSLYFYGSLIDQFDTDGSNLSIEYLPNTDQVVVVEYKDADSVTQYKTYYKNYSFSCN